MMLKVVKMSYRRRIFPHITLLTQTQVKKINEAIKKNIINIEKKIKEIVYNKKSLPSI